MGRGPKWLLAVALGTAIASGSPAVVAQPAEPEPPAEPQPPAQPQPPPEPAPAPEAPAQPPPAPVAPPPAAPHPAYAEPPPYGWGAPPPVAPKPTLADALAAETLVVVFAFGMVAGGSGDIDYECRESGAPDGSLVVTPRCLDDASLDYDDESGAGLGLDLLVHLSPSFRLGGGLLLVPSPEYKLDVPFESPSIDSGPELSLAVVVEGIFPVSDAIALVARGQGGALLLLPSEEHEDAIEQHRESCRQSGFDPCVTNEGPFIGPTVSAGGGIAVLLGDVRLRADLRLQWFSLPFLDFEEAGGGVRTEESYRLSGTRIWIIGGLEL